MLAATLVAAAYLRVITINAHGLWTDEALTIVLSNWPVIDMLVQPTDPTPFLYYAIHKLLIPANASIEAVRSISLAAGLISVGLMYLVGRLALGAAGGLLAAALLAVWSMHVDYSQEARAYSLLFLLTLLTSLGLLYYAQLLRRTRERKPSKADSGRRWFALAIFGAGNVLSFYTHVVSTFWIVLTCLMLLALILREPRTFKAELRAVFGLMVVCAVPGAYWLMQQVLLGHEFHWLRQPSLVGFFDTSATVFLPVGLWDNPLTRSIGATGLIKALVAFVSVIFLGVGLWTGRMWLRRSFKKRPAVLWLILAYLMVPIGVWLFGFAARPLFIDRVILFSVPGMILLITAACLAFGERKAAMAAMAVVLLYGVSALISGSVREKEDWRGAYHYLAGSASPVDVIAICPLYNYPALRYHADAPVGSAVVAVAGNGSLVEIEHGLGTNPGWDKTYFDLVQAPRFSRQPGAMQGIRSTVNVWPGQSIWRIEGHCNPGFSADLDAALKGISPDPDAAWIQKRRDPHTFGVVVRRYRVVAPIGLAVRDIAPQRRDTGVFRGVGRVP
jgi:mannosyltransferase